MQPQCDVQMLTHTSGGGAVQLADTDLLSVSVTPETQVQYLGRKIQNLLTDVSPEQDSKHFVSSKTLFRNSIIQMRGMV